MTHIALLRGINVGRAKRVAMADLRALVAGLGYGDVRTLLNSGNVVFTATTKARGAAARIEAAMVEQLGVASKVTVLPAADLAAIMRENTLAGLADDHSRLLVAVLSQAADRAKLGSLARMDWTPDSLVVGSRAVYVWAPGGQLESRAFEAVARTIGDAMTTRNWATMLKLYAMTEGASS